MQFYNIHNPVEKASLKEVSLRSISSIDSLFLPESLQPLPDAFFKMLPGMGLKEIALALSTHVFGDAIDQQTLRDMIKRSFNFIIPLKVIDQNTGVLELFHGPTMAFKDVGARFMAEIVTHFLKEEQKEVTILVATSGDTGGAVASAFFNKPRIKVVVLYPSGKVSEIQEKQLTGLGGNVTALEVKGTFDDCQLLVKQAFSDKELNKEIHLTSANSINFSRLFPQVFYYFFAIAQLRSPHKKVVFSVPSGNFGNLTAGLIAKKLGLPVSRFIAATNANKSVPDYLNSGVFSPQKTIHTLTNAMDVGNPSNFPRIVTMYNSKLHLLQSDVSGYSFSDEETMIGMRNLYDKYSYVADPHGAIGFLGLQRANLEDNEFGIFLETAHPSKFPTVVKTVFGDSIAMSLKESDHWEKKNVIKMEVDFDTLKRILT